MSQDRSARAGVGGGDDDWRAGGSRISNAVEVCIDNGMKNPPSGTTGQCAELGNSDGVVGPEIVLANSESNGAPCEENNAPSSRESFVLDDQATTLKVGGRACVAVYRGQPTPVGPVTIPFSTFRVF